MLHLFWRNIRGREELSPWRNGTMGNDWRWLTLMKEGRWHWEWGPLVFRRSTQVLYHFRANEQQYLVSCPVSVQIGRLEENQKLLHKCPESTWKKINWLKILTRLKLTNGYIIWNDWLSRTSFTMTVSWGGFVILTKLRTKVVAGSILPGGSNGTSAEWVLVIAAGYSDHPIYSNSQAWFQSPGHNL